MKTSEKLNLTVNALLLILLALFILSGSMMWLQHGHYHTGWMGQSDLQSMPAPFSNNAAE